MSLLAQIERRSRVSNTRYASRRKLSLVSQGSTAAHECAPVVIHDLSQTGVLIETKARISPGERLEIEIQEAGAAAATVIWTSGRFFGCQFEQPLPKSALSAAILRNAPPAQPGPAAMLGNPSSSADAKVDEKPDKWPVASRIWLLLILGAASWAVTGLVVWGTLAAAGLA